MFHYVSCGLPNVYLKNGYSILETPFGNAVSIQDVEGLHTQIAVTIAQNERRLTGTEFRFLRKYLDMSQSALGQIIGVSDQTIANYEKTEPVETADKFIRLIVKERAEGSVKILELIEDINALDREVQEERHLVFESSEASEPTDKSHWRESAEEAA